jgi:hypothetical protein
VFTETEAQKFVDRELHKLYVEKDGLKVDTFHKYTWLAPTDKISVEDVDGSVNNMRIKAIDGWLPGTLGISGVSRDAVEYPPRLFVVANTNPAIDPVSPPAPLVGTFIDLASVRRAGKSRLLRSGGGHRSSLYRGPVQAFTVWALHPNGKR